MIALSPAPVLRITAKISPAPWERPGKRSTLSRCAPGPLRLGSGPLFLPRHGLSGRWGPPCRRHHGRHWAADPPGRFPQRSLRHPPCRHSGGQLRDPYREHDACGVGFVARASGARSHEVVSMALEAVARVAHRGAASTDTPGDGAGLLTQIPAASVLPRRLPPRPSSAAGPAVRRRLVLPAPRARGPRRRGRHDRRGAGGGRHPVPRLERRAPQPGGPRADGAGLLPGDPPGAGRPSGPRRGRRGVGACPLPRTTRDGATCGRAKSRTAFTSAPSPAAPSSTRRSSRELSSQPSTTTSATPSTRARSRSSTSATRPTRCRAGRWRSRSGCWPTTARSTRSGATGTR